MDKSSDPVFPALFDDLLLYFRNSPVVDNMVWGRTGDVYFWFNSHRQLIYRVARGLAEVFKFLSVHSSI